MTDVEIAAWAGLVTAISGLLGVLMAIYVQLRVTHKLINSRMDQLLELSTAAAHAEGMLAEQAQAGRRSGDPGR